MLYVLLLSMTALSGAQAVERPQVTRAQIKEVVTKVMQVKHIPGLSIAISMPDGKVIEDKLSFSYNDLLADSEFQARKSPEKNVLNILPGI